MSLAAGTIADMRMYVEGWSPEYGSPMETEQALAPSSEDVDYSVEQGGTWEPVLGSTDPAGRIAFVDGVERVDARVTFDGDGAPVAGLCGSFGVGAVVWDRSIPRSEFAHLDVTRLVVQSGGLHIPMPEVGMGLEYETVSVEGDDPALLVRALHERMRSAEASLAAALADSGLFVVADGPISELHPRTVIGMIKAHHAQYLDEAHLPIVSELEPGLRTPLFLIRSGKFSKYSWYQRLARLAGGHSWSGVVRCVAPEAVGFSEAKNMANDAATLLPLVASEPHIDPRAPQNLVPIGALEKELRRGLGDQGLVYRALREAVATQGVPS